MYVSPVSDLSTHDLTQRSTPEDPQERHHQYLSTHDLTQRSTQPVNTMLYLTFLSTHDLTQRSTTSRGHIQPNSEPFNSRPHAEVDKRICRHWNGILLSTHDLTQRSTTHGIREKKDPSSFNSRPHAEVDLDASGYVCSFVVFQLTTSRRGRQNTISLIHRWRSFQLTTSRRGRQFSTG